MDAVLDLIRFGGEPGDLGSIEYDVEHHQTLGRTRNRRPSAVAIVWLADGSVQALVMDMEVRSLTTPARVRGGEFLPRELGEKVARVVVERDARELRVVARPAHARMQPD